MQKSFFQFIISQFKDFIEATVNILIFLPYFFSVTSLLRTLFLPWKNMVAIKKGVGFSFTEWATRQFFNCISRGIGFIMRICILLFYFILQIVYLILLPVIVILFLLSIPLFYLEYVSYTSNEKNKETIKKYFLSVHTLKPENRQKVDDWFELSYSNNLKNKIWWKLYNLFSIPPLARDWAFGFTPTLDQYTTDLMSTSYQRRIKHMMDRQKEIKLIEQALCSQDEANVIIVGDEGVGKHTIVDALSKKMYEGKSAHPLMYKRILKLNMEKILTKYTDQMQREDFLDELLKEAVESRSVILMIESLDKYLTSLEGRVDLSIPLEKYARTSDIQIIGITTPFFYEKIISQNEKIFRILTKITVKEVSNEEAEKILLDIVPTLESQYHVIIPYETIKTIIEKSEFYISYIPFPEKAVDLLDNICIYVTEKDKTNNQRIETIMPNDVDVVLTEKTLIQTSLTKNLQIKLIEFESLLKAKIIQQDDAVKIVATSLRRSFVLIGKRKKPIASFLFLGPTGVGKTETAKIINSIFFGDHTELLRFDMSLYQSTSDIQKLIGSFETNNPGLLTSAIREHPYGVLLLDEIEKADKELINIFLTILDEGYFTSGNGKRIDCKNLIIVATSNAGSDYLYLNKQSQEIVPSPNFSNNDLINYLIEQRLFSPEFLNRFDGVVVYKSLSTEAIITIAKQKIAEIGKDIMKLHKITLIVSDEHVQLLAHKGYDPKFGARNMERLIRDEIEDKVAKMILENQVREGDIIRL